MLRIRTVKTASGASAVQVIYYLKRKRVIYKHIGSARTAAEVGTLKAVAQDFPCGRCWHRTKNHLRNGW